MARVVLPFFLLIHVAPFLYFYSSETWLEQLIVLTVQFAFLVGMLAVYSARTSRHVDMDMQTYRSRSVLLLCFAAYATLRLPFISQVVSALWNGTYLDLAVSLSVQRYQNPEIEIAPYFNFGTVFFFAYAFLVGAYVPKRRRGRSLPLLLFLFSLLIESSSLAKAGVVIALAAFLSELVIRSNYKLSGVSFATITKYIGLTGGLGLALITTIAMARLRDVDNALSIVLFDVVPSYTFAPHGALLVWLESVREFSYSVGYNTFSFLFKLAGVSFPQGMYEPVNTPVGPTNVFLMYRGLLDDFGIPGAVAIMFVGGAAIAYYSSVRPRALGYFLVRLYLLLIFFPPISFMNFTTAAAGFFLSYLLVMLEYVSLRSRG